MPEMKSKGSLKVVDGNLAAALGAKLARPTVVSVYPITPQSSCGEYLAKFVASGELDAEIVEPEGEHSVMSILQGAAFAGSRTFTATASQGLFFMFEAYLRTSGVRLPIVMAIATREIISPNSVASGQSDAWVVRECGWIQLWAENCQEVLDTVIMAYKIAEHDDVRLPVNVCYDGFYISYLYEPVIVPDQKAVDDFLGPFKTRVVLDPEIPMSVDSGLVFPEEFSRFRASHLQAMEAAKRVINEVDCEYGEIFGRSYGGLLEGYRMDDADLVLLAVGCPAGTARVAVDQARQEDNLKVGLVKVKSTRPFPRGELCKILDGRAGVGVLDKNVSWGWSSGSLFWETKAALYEAKTRPPMINFIGGLAGADIRIDMLRNGIKLIAEKAEGKKVPEVNWFHDLGDLPR